MRGRRDTLDTPKKKDWKPQFLKALRHLGVVRHACEQAHVPYKTAYRRRDEEQAFREDWDEALDEAADLLELEARRRAVDGIDKPIYHQGEEIDVVKSYSDTLLIFLLKGARPGKYRDNVHHEVTGKGGGPVRFRAEDLTDDELAAIVDAGRRADAAAAAGTQ
jgi:hypothetical protein